MKLFKISAKLEKLLTHIFIYVLALWLLLGIYSLVRNYASLVKNEIAEIYLTDDEKRFKYLGTVHQVLLEVNQIIPQGSRVYIVGDDQRTNFMSKYFLYPILVSYSVTDPSVDDLSEFEYLVLIDNTESKVHPSIPKKLSHKKSEEIVVGNYKAAIFKL